MADSCSNWHTFCDYSTRCPKQDEPNKQSGDLVEEKMWVQKKGSVVDDKMLTKRVTVVIIKVSISGVCKMLQGTRNRAKII